MNLEGFDIQEQLGRGGMATVYRARQISLDREVAIKVFEPGFEPTPEDREQFQNEARTAARLKHPGLVQVYDAIFTNETYCFVMELVQGYTVGAWSDRKGHLTEAQVLDIADYVAAALDYAWTQHQIIHCDIKPENLMVDADGTVKILDLGLCKTAQAMLQHSGTEDQVYGTPQYLSPEQAIGQSDLDCRTDIYALGATMFHIATGSMLFPGTDGSEAMDKQVRAKAPNPGTLNPALSPAFCSLVEKMLAKDRDRRQLDWRTVRSDIEAARLGLPLPSGNPIPGASTVESAPPPKAAAEKPTKGKVAKVKIAPQTRSRVKVAVPEAPLTPGPMRGSAFVPPPPAPAASSSHKLLVPGIVLGVLVAGAIGVKMTSSAAQARAAREKRAADVQQALLAAENADKTIHRDDPSLESIDQAIALYQKAAADFPELSAQVAPAIDSLQMLRKEAEAQHRRARFEALRQQAVSLTQAGSYDQAIALFRDDPIGNAPEFSAERKRALDAIQETRRVNEAELARQEAEQRRKQEEAARRAELTTATYTRLLDAFRQNGLGVANSLLDEIEANHPELFTSNSNFDALRTLFRGIRTAQERFESAFKPSLMMSLELRNGASFRGRLLRVNRTDDELIFVTTLNGIDYNKTILFRELAPKEILTRLGNNQDPGTRYVRVRLFRRFDLPVPSPTFLESQCEGFPPDIRAAALK